MDILVTGGSGVLGRATVPLLEARGHAVAAPARHDLDLFDPAAVAEAVRGARAVYHLATRIPRPEAMRDRAAWAANDALRAEASRLLVDAALERGVRTYVQPTVAMVYGAAATATEDTPLPEVPAHLRSALAAEEQALRFAAAGRTGVVLRLGLLYGPGTATQRGDARGFPSLHVEDAGRALVAALGAPSGLYNVVEDGSSVSNTRFKQATGWQPRR